MLNNLRLNSYNEPIFANCARKRSDKELSHGVTFLKDTDTGLSCDIIVDCGERYKKFNHPLCIYVVNGDEVVPVTVSEFPKTEEMNKVPIDVISFIIDNATLLKEFADMNISGPKFFNAIDSYMESKEKRGIVVEMSNYGPDDTGLPIWVYVDDTDSYIRSGHNGSYRIKFQQDKDIKDPERWMPVTIPGLKIMKSKNVPPCKEPKRNVNKVILWAKYNTDLLLKLKNKEITGKAFAKSMFTLKDIKVILKSEKISHG